MRQSSIWMASALTLLLGLSSFAATATRYDESDADKAAKIYKHGTELLAKGDFQSALKAYAQAGKTNPEEKEYKKQYLTLRRIIAMRERISTEEDPARWDKYSKALRNYYYSNRLYGELHTLAKQIHAKKNTLGSALLLTDALLSLDRNAEAVKVLTARDDQELTTHARLLLGIALGRLKRLDDAKKQYTQIQLPENPAPRMLCDFARLQVLLNDVSGAMATLTKALETTSAKAHPSFKDYIKRTPEFRALAPEAGLAKVLLTESKVKESACSGGSDCGSCPSRGGCSGGSGK